MNRKHRNIYRLLLIIGVILVSVPTQADNFLPKYTHYTLSNGLEVYLVENHSLPMIHTRMIFKSGSTSDPQDLSGLAFMTTQLLTTATEKYPSESLTVIIDSTGGMIGPMVGYDMCGLRGSFLTRDLGFALSIMSEMVKSPEFSEATLDNLRRRSISNSIREQRVVSRILNFVFKSQIYGNQGYGLPIDGTFESLEQIEVEHLKMFHRDNICAGNSILILTGDFNKNIAQKIIKDEFSDWSKCGQMKSPDIINPDHEDIKILIIDNPDAESSEYLIGREVDVLNSESGAAFRMLNYMLGGSGSISILAQRLMTKYFLVTDISSTVDWNKESATFKLMGSSSNNNLSEAIEKSLAEMEYLTEVKLPLSDIEDARNYHRNIFASVFENSFSTANQFAEFVRIGNTPEYYHEFLKGVETITPDDLRNCARKYFNRKGMIIVISGPALQIKSSLSKIGPIKLIKMSRN